MIGNNLLIFKTDLLNYFFEQRKKIINMKFDSLQSMKAYVESSDYIKNSDINNIFFINLVKEVKNTFKIQEYIMNKELKNYFNFKNSNFSILEININIISYFYNITEILKNPNLNKIAICNGFYSTILDIFEVIYYGYNIIIFHVLNNDVYYLQYALEIAREYNLIIILVCHNEKELKVALETDAEYLALWAYSCDLLDNDFTNFVNLASKISKNKILFVLSSYIETKNLLFLQKYKIKGCILK